MSTERIMAEKLHRAILGLDAAWTGAGSSGVVLAAETGRGIWRAVALHGSYRDFIAAAGIALPETFEKMPGAMVEAAAVLAPEATLWAIVVDMPLSKLPITGRRAADNLVSKAFGGAGCSTHTPSAVRPGPIAVALRDGFGAVGFPLATEQILLPGLYETYPHPALLHLMQVAKRVPYKVAKASKLWPNVLTTDRWRMATRQLQAVAGRLETFIGGAVFGWPAGPVPMASLKTIEDQIDALVCAWVGTLIVDDAVTPFGDADAAVWLPAALMIS
jgi:predicted RNase H-like nuclease